MITDIRRGKAVPLKTAIDSVMEKLSTAKPNLLDEVQKTFAEREAAYGSQEDCFGAIADCWNGYLRQRKGKLTGRDVCMMMVQLKTIRDANATKYDNLVDIAGYAVCADRLKGTD